MPSPAWLLYNSKNGVEQRCDLNPLEECKIGRHPACKITVVNQLSVSREHARIFFKEGHFQIEDLNSSNGTYRNEQRIQLVELKDGDQLRCGDMRFQFREVLQRQGTPIPVAQAVPVPLASAVPRAKPVPLSEVNDSASPLKPVPRARPLNRRYSQAPQGRKARKRLSPAPGGMKPRRVVLSRQDEPVEAIKPDLQPPKAKPSEQLLSSKDQLHLQEVERELKSLETLREQQEEQLSELNLNREDQERRIQELERGRLRDHEKRDTLSQRILDLKGENQGKQRQLEALREEKKELELELLKLQDQHKELQGAQSVSDHREGDLAGSIADLKREVRQKERENKELQHQISELEYDLGHIEEENANLQLALGDDNSTRKALNTTIEHLRQVLSEKEVMLGDLQAEISRERRRSQQLEERAQAGVGEGQESKRLREELSATQAIRDELNRSKQSLEQELEELRGELQQHSQPAPNIRELMEQLNKLRRSNRELKHQLEESASPEHGPELEELQDLRLALKDSEAERQAAQKEKRKTEHRLNGLQAELSTAQEQVQQLQVELKAAQQQSADPAQPSPAQAEGSHSAEEFVLLKGAAIKSYESINDLASELRMNIEQGQTSVQDLDPLIKLVVQAVDQGIDNAMTTQLGEALHEADALWSLESALEALKKAHEGSESFKRALRRFREVLYSFGYGS